MADNTQEKTEQATPRKREQAREKGQVARSRDLTSMASMGGMIILLYFSGAHFISTLAEMTGGVLGMRYGRDAADVMNILVSKSGLLLAPYFIIAVVAALLASAAQGGFVWKPVKFELDKLSPAKGMKKIFSAQGATELMKSLLKVSMGCWVVYYIIRRDMDMLPALSAMEIGEITRVAGRMLMNAILISFLYFLSVAIVSAIIEKWQHEKSLRMSKQEIKDELKQTEGDPLIKSRIRSVQREAARKRMMQEVPKATVVITNPQHLAVAIRYEEKKMHAPKIVAKGAGVVAAKIKEIAAEHGVPIVEDKPVARSLYKFELNSFIPEELYVSVARILAYIYKLKGKA